MRGILCILAWKQDVFGNDVKLSRLQADCPARLTDSVWKINLDKLDFSHLNTKI